MREKNIVIHYKGKKLRLKLKICGRIEKIIGLMFSKKERASALLFEFNKSVRLAIHSWFVFYPFLVIWLDDENQIIEKKIIKPFTVAVRPKEKFFRLIEIPINSTYEKIIKLLVGD